MSLFEKALDLNRVVKIVNYNGVDDKSRKHF